MNIQRLQILSSFLRTLNVPGKFNIGAWMINNDSYKEQFISGEIHTDEHDYHWAEVDGDLVRGHCGTTACAFGYACTIPELRAEGLKLRIGSYNKGDLRSFEPTFGEYTDWEAAEHFFELSDEQSEWLFLGELYVGKCGNELQYSDITPQMVAARIDALIADPGMKLDVTYACV